MVAALRPCRGQKNLGGGNAPVWDYQFPYAPQGHEKIQMYLSS
jgi:hypothetical protein